MDRRCLWRGARLQRPREAWDPPYTREVSPGKKARKRVDKRATTDFMAIISQGDKAARDEMIRVGILHKWQGETCLKCGRGKYGVRNAKGLHVCGHGKCHKKVSEWHASCFRNSGMPTQKCLALAVDYAARLSPTQASIRERVGLKTTSKYWAYFRAAEAAKGLELRDNTLFEGTPDNPCEVEVDECAVKKKYVRDPYLGQIVGTWHYCVFAMKPRFVEASASGKPSPPRPPSEEELGPWIARRLGQWCVVHADGAQAYPAIIAEILKATNNVYLDQVDHSGYQFTRFHRHTVRGQVYPHSRIRVTAGTNFVEGWWDQLKHNCIPEEIGPCVPVLEQYVLGLLWRTFSSGDPTEDLGSAVQCFMKRVDFHICTLREELQEQDDQELQDALLAWFLPAGEDED